MHYKDCVWGALRAWRTGDSAGRAVLVKRKLRDSEEKKKYFHLNMLRERFTEASDK